MVRKIAFFIILFIHLFTFVSAAPLQYLTKSVVSETSFDTAPSQWNNPPDDGQLLVSIGFNFPFNNTTYNQLRIGTNGAFTFGSNGNFAYNNQALSYRAISIYPYWDDLNPRRGGRIRYGRLNAGGANDRFVISWEGVPHYNNAGNYTFQAILYPDGTIRFRYDATSDADGDLCGNGCNDLAGNGATIGVEEDSTHFDQHSFDALIDQTKDILYYRPANINIVKSSCVLRDPVNGTTNPKRIPGATIRYAFEVTNSAVGTANNVIIDDTLNASFNTASIVNLQIQSGVCNCAGVTSASANPAPGTGNGVHPIKLNFGTVAGGSVGTPTRECGYFEVDIQ